MHKYILLSLITKKRMAEGKTLITDLPDEPPQHPPPPGTTPFDPEQPQPLPPLLFPDDAADEQDVVEKGNPTVNVVGYELDVDSAIVMCIITALWVLVWRTTGVLDIPKQWAYMAIFYAFIVYTAVNMVTSGSKSGSVLYELNILLTVEQMIAILFGTVMVFVLFNDKMNIHPTAKRMITRIGYVILIILSFASMWINVITSGRAFRAIRKAKQGLYNVSYALFVVIGLLAYNASSVPPPS
jgi:hypothetical protein